MKRNPMLNVWGCLLIVFGFTACVESNNPVLQRVIVSTDIGGTDYDDYQSIVHVLLYADTFDLEGLISSPYGEGGAGHILEAINAYEKDYPNLKTYSDNYPTAYELRKVVKQGAKDAPGHIGYDKPTEGSKWIIACAKKDDPRPLNVLIWGGIEDLAQALHDAPDILPKLRVHFIGGPNKKWSVNAYQYIAENFPNLWIIESNATYRGWFVGGNQSGKWGNKKFVETHVKNAGALGAYFYAHGGQIKMGDTPSFTYLFNGNPADPSQPSWGGQYVRAWERPHKIFNRITNEQDSIEQFGVLELRIPATTDGISEPFATLNIDRPIKGEVKNDTVRFLFSPKYTTQWNYTISSNIPSLEDVSGTIKSYFTPVTNKQNPSPRYANWWTDDPSPEFMEKGHIGIKTVNVWREEFLNDFAKRMARCVAPANGK